jgi:hypothetical protein
MSRNIVLQLNTDLQLPPIISLSAQGEKALRVIIESLLAQGLASVHEEVHESLNEKTVMSDLKSVNVWFNPETDFNLRQNTPVIIDSRMVGAFEDILSASTPIDSDTLRKKFNPKAWVSSHCRAQIFSQTATTDIRTAEVIANYFRAIENSDFTAVESMLAPFLTCRVPEKFYDFAEMRTREEYLGQLIPYRQKHKELWFDVTWAYVQSTKAVIEFCLWSEGKVVCSGLTQYSFQLIDNVPIIYSIYSHSVNADGSVLAAEDGTLQWTQLGQC